MLLSCIIISYNNEDTIQDCITSCLQHLPAPSEIIVWDNASTDRTPQILEEIEGIQVFLSRENSGYAPSCNLASQKALGEFILFLNPDCALTENCINRMILCLQSKPEVAMVGPISNYAGARQSLRYYLEHKEEYNLRQNADQVRILLEEQYAKTFLEVKLLIGFCILISKQTFAELKGMDDALPLGMDDLDLSWRAQLLGKKLWILPDTFVWHQGHVSFNLSEPQKTNELEEISKFNFSQKLIQYYGHPNLVPSGWDLWEIPWFKLSLPQDPSMQDNNMIQSSSPLPTLENLDQSKTQFFILCSQSSTIEHIQQSLNQVLLLGILTENITLVCLGSSHPINHFLLDYNTYFTPHSDFLRLAQHIQNKYSFDHAFVLTAGCQIDSYSYFLEQKNPSIESGFLQLRTMPDGALLEHQTPKNWFEQSLPIILKIHRQTLINNDLPILTQFDGEFWPITTQNQSSDTVQSTENENAESRWPGLPHILQELFKNSQCPAIIHHNKVFDIYENPISISDADTHVYKLELEDILNLTQNLKNNKHKNLQQSLFIFPNSLVQNEELGNPYSHRGLSPWDVRRCIQMAGYRIDECIEYIQPTIPRQESFLGITQKTADVLPIEKLYSEAPLLLFKTTPLSTAYSLDKKVSIVLLAINKVEYTRQCIDSLLKYTKQKIELILVDNGSSDSTEQYFRSIPGAKVIRNDVNLGVSAGWNQGIREATGDYVLILNNDTIFGPHTLENLVRCAENHPQSGCVAPRSNKIAGPQLEARFDFSDIPNIPQIIDQIQKENDLSSWEFPRIKGFCMLIPAQAIKNTGFFDEQFGIGNFEDDDYSLRLFYQGYQMRVADDSFLFHYGSVSFNQAGIDWNAQMTKNMGLFDQKWKNQRADLSQYINHSEHSSPTLKTPSLAWIAFENCEWEKARNLFVADLNGSESDAELYFGLGKTLEQLNQINDAFTCFTQSLNLDPKEEYALGALNHLKKYHSDSQMYDILTIWKKRFPQLKTFQNNFNPSTPTLHSHQEKLNEASLYLDQNNPTLAFNLLLELQQEGEDSFMLWNYLGICHYYNNHFANAFNCFEKALDRNPTEEDTLINFFDTGLKTSKIDALTKRLEYALSLNPELNDARKCLEEIRNFDQRSYKAEEIIYRREMNIEIENAIREDLYPKAKQLVESLLANDPENYRAWNNFGLILWYEGDLSQAKNCFHQSCRLNLWYTDAILNLFDTCCILNQVDFFKPILNEAIALAPANKELLDLRTQIQQGIIPDRLKQYQESAQENIQLSKWLEKGKLLLDNLKVSEAIILFTDILAEYPHCDEAYNGVGVGAFYNHSYKDAFSLFKKALEYKPIFKDYLLNIWDVAQHLGEEEQEIALEHLKNAYAIDPSLEEIQEIIERNF